MLAGVTRSNSSAVTQIVGRASQVVLFVITPVGLLLHSLIALAPLTASITRPEELEGLIVYQTVAPAADGLRCLTDQDRIAGQVSSPVLVCGTIR